MIQKAKNLSNKFTEWFFSHFFAEFSTPYIFYPPMWFSILWRLKIGRELTEDDIKNSKELSVPDKHKDLKRRLVEHDFRFPLPNFLNNILYNENSKASSSGLFLFYQTLLEVLKMGKPEPLALDFILRGTWLSTKMRYMVGKVKKEENNSSESIYEILHRKASYFGNFETTLLKNTYKGGNAVPILQHILIYTQKIIQLNKSLRTIRIILTTNILIIIGVVYYLLTAVIVPITEALNQNMLPWDLRLLYGWGLYLKTVKGVITIITIVIISYAAFFFFRKTRIVGFFVLKIPVMGKFFIFADGYKFISSLYFAFAHLKIQEYPRLQKAIDAVENPFIKSFFQHRLEELKLLSQGVVYFFVNNRIFPETIVYQIEISEKSQSTLERLKGFYEFYDEQFTENLEKLPKMLEEFNFWLLIIATVLIAIVIGRLDLLAVTNEAILK